MKNKKQQKQIQNIIPLQQLSLTSIFCIVNIHLFHFIFNEIQKKNYPELLQPNYLRLFDDDDDETFIPFYFIFMDAYYQMKIIFIFMEQ